MASPTVTSCNDPLDATLWGEYARILLVGTAACSAAYWAVRLGIDRSAVVLLVINLSLLAAIIDKQFAGLPRLTRLALLASGLIASVNVLDDALQWWTPLPIFSPAMALISLMVLASRDLVIATRTRFQGISRRMIGIGGVVMLAALYMIVGPMVASLLGQFQSQPGSYQVEELTVFEMLRIRSAKLVIFAVFAYCGACVGSFINVVAASAPRGESIVLRSSACPSCKVPIRRIRLRGRQASSSLTLATILVGSALGWQAMLTIAALWLVVAALLKMFGGRRLRPRWLTPTTLLFIVVMLHHPVWKWLAWP